MNARSGTWEFWIDVGGTFTDCIALSASGEIRQFKILSSGVTRGAISEFEGASFIDPRRASDPSGFWLGATCRLLTGSGEVLAVSAVSAFDPQASRFTLTNATGLAQARSYELDLQLPAPVLAIRWLLSLSPTDKCPAVRVRFGTTRGTNALLTRTGARTALITTRGFADVPLIGNQDRPDLFDLNIKKPLPLFSKVFEVDERIAADGQVLAPLHVPESQLAAVTDEFDSVAICLMNAYANSQHEKQLEGMLTSSGLTEVSRSSEVSPLIRFVPRCDTTVLDAYLNPILRNYLNQIRRHLPGSDIQVMTSTGGLVDSKKFRGRDCILSGPAGGIVGFSTVAAAEGFTKSIGFDMGGTSTDVARFDGTFELQNEIMKAGVRIMTPVLAIETVAAGGGSICGFDGTRLFVGPQSAGADPGPACYGAGGPLTVTDLNVFLGRVLSEHFPFRLDTSAVQSRLQVLRTAMITAGATSADVALEVLAEGLLQIANDNMVQAIRKVSVAKGYLPSDYALVSFGGAGGQHACSIARQLGIRQVLIHPFAGILSAYGMGQADVRAIRQVSILKPLCAETLELIAERRNVLSSETQAEVREQVLSDEQVLPSILSLELRYTGTDSALVIAEQPGRDFLEQFESEHRRLFGYARSGRAVEVASMRVETVGQAARQNTPVHASREASSQSERRSANLWYRGQLVEAAVIMQSSLIEGQTISGPAIVCDATSTIFLEPDCVALVTASGAILIDVSSLQAINGTTMSGADDTAVDVGCAVTGAATVDPVLLEVFNNQFVSIAEQMGETLRRTSISTNVRERLDFSCALFDADGQLVVNAPHVPVHLGAMGESVRAIIADHPSMQPGDVYVTNDPFRGGSHLPDVTVVTPVFLTCQGNDNVNVPAEIFRPSFFVANRAHHAEIGGIVPGSMPPFSKNLAEEGVLIRSQKLVDRGQSCEEELKLLFASGRYPSRAISDNLADLAAQVAANECGSRLLLALAQQRSESMVQAYMKHIQSSAAKKMRLCLQELPDRSYDFSDHLDDGTLVKVSITVHGDQATVDFTGTSEVHAGNLNANRAITTAAVLYSFRCLLNEDVPLNAGVLEPVDIVIPKGLLNPSCGTTPEQSPAIVGGNVETSQRIVDVLLGALGLAAASQGTMNNLTFGDDRFGYYETICGGAGATAVADGADAVHTHMTNTRLTDPEILERRYPVLLRQFSIRQNSGGAGRFHGGNGIIREFEFQKPLLVSMLSQRRVRNAPYGLNGGKEGAAGQNFINENDVTSNVGGCFSTLVSSGTVLRIETPGGGGFGASDTAF